MYGAFLLFVLNLVLNIMSHFWMLIVVIHSFIPWQIKVIFCLFLLNGKNIWNDILIKKFKWFNLIGAVNIALYTNFCKIVALLIVFFVLTHQQNGVVERKHCHVVETGLTILYHAKIPLQFWDDAFQTACYLINRLPTSTIKNLSPFESFLTKLLIIISCIFLV